MHACFPFHLSNRFQNQLLLAFSIFQKAAVSGKYTQQPNKLVFTFLLQTFNHHNPMSRILSVTAIPRASFPTDECLHLIHVMEKQPAVGKSAKELRVEDCDKPQGEFQNVISRENNPMLILSNLTLELIQPPQLTCRCNRRTDSVSIERLKIVIVKNCQKLTSLFSFVLAGMLISLETLVIDDCHSLKQIITDGPLSFPRLTTLEITDCNMLKYVFQTTKASFPPQSMVLNTSPQLNGVMEVGNKNIQLPQLQRLALRRLKSLTTFWSGEFCIELPSFEDLEVEACPQLRICEIIERYKVKNLCLFNVRNKLCEDMIQIQGGYFLSCLKTLVLKELLDLEVIWKDPRQIVTLQNLTQLKVFGCNKLKNIFSVLLARNLLQLKHLEVQRCKELEQVISQDKISSSSMARHKPVYFPNLEEICIMECNNLKYLFPVSVSRLLKLKKLEVKDASNLREIFRQDSEADMTNDEKPTEILLPKLEELSLVNLPNLIWFTTMGYYFVFPALTSLKVDACPRRIMKFSFHDDGYVRAEIEKVMSDNVDSSITMQNILSDNKKNQWHRPSKGPVNNEVVTVKQGIDKHVAGPKDLVINSEKEVKSLKKPSPKLLINESNSMDALVKYANQSLPTDQIKVSIEDELFPYSTITYVGQEQIRHIASFGQIEVTCILIYMSLLYRRLKEQNLTQMYGFIDPSSISHTTGPIAGRINNVAYALERALPGQLFFAPYNSGNHWQLIVIDLYDDTVYFFDSIRGNREQEIKEIKEIIGIGLSSFNAQKKRNVRQYTWKTIEGPRQSEGYECGYYVMRYMKEIIKDDILSISDKEEYTKDELDEVRMEWSDYVLSFLE